MVRCVVLFLPLGLVSCQGTLREGSGEARSRTRAADGGTGAPTARTGGARGEGDRESAKIWKEKVDAVRENGGWRAVSLKSFEGIEEPTMVWDERAGAARKDVFRNITD